MTVFGDGLIERLNEESSLQDPTNPMHRILDLGVGGWLDDYDENSLQEQVFIDSSTGNYLDLHGKEYGVKRKVDESDDDYKERIILESLGKLTVEYLQEVYGLDLYVYIQDFSMSDNILSSRNPYLAGTDGFMSVVPTDIQSLLSKKFVLDSALHYIME